MIGRIGPVTSVTAIGLVPDARVYRNDQIPAGQSGGIGVYAARLDLLGTVGGHRGQRHLAQRRDRAVPGGRARQSGRRSGSASARPGRTAGVPRRPVVHRHRRPAPGAARPELDSGALIGWPAAESTSGLRRSPDHRLHPGPGDPGRGGAGGAGRHRQPGEPQRGAGVAARPTRSRPSRPPTPRSPPCCSASARSPCSSAASAWPTPWSSRCWSAGPRSACAARSAPPAARSGSSSWSSRCCSPPSVGPAVCCSASW